MKYIVTRIIREVIEVEADHDEEAIILASEADEYQWDGNRGDPTYRAAESPNR